MLILALASSVAISWNTSRTASDALLDQGRHITTSFAKQSALALLYAAPENAADALDGVMSFQSVVGAAIYQADGTPLLMAGDVPETACLLYTSPSPRD